MKSVSLVVAALLAACAAATPALADRFVVLAATDQFAYAADLEKRADQPNGHVRFEVERGSLGGHGVRYDLLTYEADCAKGVVTLVSGHAMQSATMEASPPRSAIIDWVTPKPNTLEEAVLKGGCAPSFPKAAVIDTGEGDQNFQAVLDNQLRAALGLRPGDRLTGLRGRGR